MMRTKISWANRIGALSFPTALAPSERHYADKPRTHKTLTVWAKQLLLQIKRWVGERAVIAVGDSSYAVIDLPGSLQGQVSLISRLRLDAALYGPVPVRAAGQRGRKRLKGERLPTLLAMANDGQTHWDPLRIRDWYGGQDQTVAYCTGRAICGAARAVSHRQVAGGHPLGIGASSG